MNIRIDGLQELNRFANNITRNTKEATRIAINTSLKWGRTRIREDIGKEYNIKLGRLYSSNREKGLNIKNATTNNLEGKITAGHMPVGLSAFNGTRQASETSGYRIAFSSNMKTRKTRTLRTAIKRSAGMSIEVRKGKRQVIRSAFQIPKYGKVVFARGQYSAFGFLWRHKRASGNSTGDDKPIEGLNATSVATMALTQDVFNRWDNKIIEHYENEMQRQIKRLL